MNQLIWRPDAKAIQNSQLTAFSRGVDAQHNIGLDGDPAEDYAKLHAWSTQYPGEFWQAFWTFTGIRAEQASEEVVLDPDKFPGARWFPQARLNYAENLLSEPGDKTAFISMLENGHRETHSYADIYRQTERIAWQLCKLGISPGDRVAGWLPNIVPTATTMLASSSIGAVYSSCSPDFGEPGALDRFGQIEPKVLFACDGYFYAGKTISIRDKVRRVAGQVPSIHTIVWVGVPGLPEPVDPSPDNTMQEVSLQDWLNQPAEPLTFTQLPFDHPLYILYSSGTTGKPKCIVHGQGGTLMQHKKEHQLHLDLRADDTLFFFTTCGWMMWNWLISALASHCTVVLFDGSPFHPTPSAMFDLCQAEQVDIFGISAKFLSGAHKAGIKPRETHNLSRMRMLISTGSPLTQEGFQYVYRDIDPNCHLVSMSGGTDLISCFMLGNPNLPVYDGELQCAGLGMAVDIWDEQGNSVINEKGELVCTTAFPSAPVGFWNDPDNKKYHGAYFEQYPNVWVHGDYAEKTANGGYIIHGRSDAVLNPGGVRIGTAEIYRQVENFAEVADAVCIGQEWEDDVRVVLFVVMQAGARFSTTLADAIKLRIRNFASPRHTPALILEVDDIPRTMSGKIAELAVRDVVHNRPVKNTSALANPEALENFRHLPALQVPGGHP